MNACNDAASLVADPIREEINRLRQSAKENMIPKEPLKKQDRFIAISVQDQEEKSPSIFDSPSPRGTSLEKKPRPLIWREDKRE